MIVELIDYRPDEILEKIINENREFIKIFLTNTSIEKIKSELKKYLYKRLDRESIAYYRSEISGQEAIDRVSWQNYATIRLLDYIDYNGLVLKDNNLRGAEVISEPITTLYYAINKKRDVSSDFLLDMLYLLRQFNGRLKQNIPSKEKIIEWMDRHHSGIEPEIVELRAKNRDRIITKIIQKIDRGEIRKYNYTFSRGVSFREKYKTVQAWWETEKFHIRFAFRDYKLLNEMLDYSLDKKTLKLLESAKKRGIPLFVNPHYASLLLVNPPEKYKYSDMAIRSYLFASQELIDEFGHIVAWEKEDIIKPNEPNSAGWILPEGNVIHRRYPEVAIFIPKTRGRSCGGLCVSCQRMYGFQNGEFDFDLKSLDGRREWSISLPKYLEYFENDSQLRDILITGGDALMNSDRQLKEILDGVYTMAKRKYKANKNRAEKYALMSRIRLGTRLLVFIPQRITDNLIEILKDFKDKASKIGFNQFIIQTHFESAIEITPEVKKGVEKILSSGWIITNQNVFTPAVSIRGHISHLRKSLNDIGILPYYTFSVKGFRENSANFTNNARTAQEIREEKILGKYSDEVDRKLAKLPKESHNLIRNLKNIRDEIGLPFLSSDRNVMNLPAVGKSMTFRTVGITSDGRRVLEFNHDFGRKHSPIIESLGKVYIIESKSIKSYLKQIEEYGEDINQYSSIWGYSMFETERRSLIYEYSLFKFRVTDKITNFQP